MGIQERKEREKEHRRDEILNAAQKVFFEKGLQASTMDEIAEAAELSKGTLYLYFKSKEDLYLAVMTRGMELLQDLFDKAISEADSPLDQIRKMGQAYRTFFNEHRNFFRMFSFFQHPQFHKQVSEDMMAICHARNQEIWQKVISIIKRGIEQGFLRDDLDPAECAIMLWSNSYGLMVRMDTQLEYFRENFGVDLEKLIDKSSELLLQSMMTDEVREKMSFSRTRNDEQHS
jgi:AcrR family transcriptional regulator